MTKLPENRHVPLLKQVVFVQGGRILSQKTPVRFAGHWQINRLPFVIHVEPFTHGEGRHGLVKFWHKGPVNVELTQTHVKFDVAKLVKHNPLGEQGLVAQGSIN